MWTSSGAQSTTLVVSRTIGSSASATFAITYGGSKPGSHCCELTVKPTTVARPDTTLGAHERLRHSGQIGTGGCTNLWQSLQRWMRSMPSAPDVQNQSLKGVSCGSGRMVLLIAARLAGSRAYH